MIMKKMFMVLITLIVFLNFATLAKAEFGSYTWE